MSKTVAIWAGIAALAPAIKKLVGWGKAAWERRKAKKDRKLEKIRESESK